MGKWLGTLAFVALALRAHAAVACVDPPPEEHVVDPTLADDEAPGVIEEASFAIFRGNDREIAEADGCGQREVRSSCEGTASLTIFVEPPPPPERIGYLIELVDGEAPAGLLPETAVSAAEDGSITLHWDDGDGESQELVSFSVTMSAVDEAGNVGEPSEALHVFDAGSDAGGCQIARGLSGSWLPSALLSLLALTVAGRMFRRIQR